MTTNLQTLWDQLAAQHVTAGHTIPAPAAAAATRGHWAEAITYLRHEQHERNLLRATIGRTLDELGHTADEVADRLRARQIRGAQNSTCDCPIARVILAVPGVAAVTVIECSAHVRAADGSQFEVDLPEPVSAFIHHFDSSRFFDLVEQPGGEAR